MHLLKLFSVDRKGVLHGISPHQLDGNLCFPASLPLPLLLRLLRLEAAAASPPLPLPDFAPIRRQKRPNSYLSLLLPQI
ncbi:hypothetical protein KSP40_PGU007744 [Platanthera guangdongensis]|uniref:Uncharacterized protein n=1 Tax=Platanthera guangdongensis TaxID=2320717 RepID=A0ABR2LUQ1_9ASPA